MRETDQLRDTCEYAGERAQTETSLRWKVGDRARRESGSGGAGAPMLTRDRKEDRLKEKTEVLRGGKSVSRRQWPTPTGPSEARSNYCHKHLLCAGTTPSRVVISKILQGLSCA